MADVESTMQWKVDITQFTAAMQEAKKALQNTNSEFKLTTSTMDKWGNNTAGLEAKIRQLGGQIEAETRILEVYANAWEEAKKEFGEASPEAQRLAKQVENQQVKINKTQVSLDKYTAKLDQMQKEQQESESATGKLNKEIDDQQKKVDDLKKAYKDSLVGDNPDEAKRLAKELKEASSELKDMKNQMKDADKAADALDDSLDDVDDSVASASDGFTVFKGVLSNLVTQGINLVINGMKDLAKETFTAGANFESAMSKVQAVSGASAEDMALLTEKAQEMGAKTKFSASEAADAFNYMAMAGWKTEDMLGGIEGIMNLAAASGADLATTSDIVTDALTAMGYSAEDAGRLADVMAAASSNANTNVEMMGATFQYAAPIIGALGYEMEDAAVAIGLMANAGIKGEKAGTALRSILTRLSAPPKEAAEAMDALGISLTDSQGNMKDMDEVIQDLRKAFEELDETEQTMYAKQLAGQEAMSGLLAIVRAAPEDYNKLTDAVANSAGAAERMANVMNDNVSGQMTLLKSKIEGIMIKVFEKMSTSIRKALNTVSKALDQVDWDKFADTAGDAAKAVADLFAYVVKNASKIVTTLKTVATAFVTYKAVTTITSVTGAFTKMFKAVKAGQLIMQAMNLTLAVNPYALIAAGIAAVTVAMVAYTKKQKEAIEAEYGLTKAQKEHIEAAELLKETTEDTADAMSKSSESVAVEYKRIDDLKSKYNDLIDSNGKVKEGYEDRAEYILNELANALGVEREEINKVIEANGKLGESYDTLAVKRKASAMLEAAEADYNQALVNQAKAVEQKVTAYNDLVDAQMRYDEAVANGGAVYDAYMQLVRDGMAEEAHMYYLANESKITAIETTKSALDQAQQGYDNAATAWQNSTSTIMQYNDLLEASTSGNVDEMNAAMLRMQYGFITAENGTRDSLERQTANFRQMYDDWKKAADSGMEGVSGEQLAQLEQLIQMSEAELAKLPPEANKEGQNTGREFSSGLESQSSAAKTSGTKVADEAKKGAESVHVESSGRNFGQGFLNGIGEKISAAWSKGWELAKAAWNGLRAGGGEGSPWKTTIASGEFFGEGFELGIQEMIKPVTQMASTMAKEAVSALGDNMDAEMLKVGMNGGNSLVNGLKSASANIADLKTGVASANFGMTGYGAVGTASSGNVSNTVNFYQTNNSPKALNRWDIFRQTQNILALSKG